MENLLDKFIRNEKKAKLWALLSLLAFFATAATVVGVAYNIKNEQEVRVVEVPPTFVTDTVFLSKEDTTTAALLNDQSATIRLLRDSCKYLEDNYQLQLQEVDKYIGLWKECQNKSSNGGDPPPPPPANPISVMIYTIDVPDTSREKLKKFISYRDNTKNGMKVYTQEKNGVSRGIIYYGDQFADQANYIAGILSQSGIFNPRLRLNVIRGEASGPADIVIWAGFFR